MGLRGPLPAIRTKPAAALASLDPPDWLGDEGQGLWRRHAPYLAENHLLTEQTAESWGITCDLYDRLCGMRGAATTRAFLDLQKAYATAAKLFRLLPCDKPGGPPDGRHENKSEFKFQ